MQKLPLVRPKPPQLLDAVLADADHDQQAQLVVLTEAHRHVHPIDEQVRVAREREQPLAEPLVMGLPLLAQPADRRRRQPRGVLAEQPIERRPEVAGRQPLRYRIGSTSVTFGDRRAYAGRILEENRWRSPVSSSTRLSFTRGARTGSVPEPTVTRRSRARPLRTTSRFPSSSSSSSLNCSTYSSASARSAAAIIRRAPSRASSSSVNLTSSLSSPTGSVRTSTMACLPFSPLGANRS